MRGKFGLEFET